MEARHRLFHNRIGVDSEVQVYIHVWGMGSMGMGLRWSRA